VGLRERAPSVLLGAFILFELIYLPAANAIKLVPLRLPEARGELDDDIQLRGKAYPEPVQRALDSLGAAMCRWGELTGQAQGWSLFAPLFGHQASLPTVGLVWMTPPRRWYEELLSRFEPKDADYYFRLPGTECRLFNYEYRLALLYWTWSWESFAERRGEWRQAALDRVRRQQRSMLAYMRWRMDRYLLDNPGRPTPDAVELYAHLIPTPPPGSVSSRLGMPSGFRTMFLARWFPNTALPPGCLPVQAYDPEPGPATWVWLPEEE
jgi:hypothetical protein